MVAYGRNWGEYLVCRRVTCKGFEMKTILPALFAGALSVLVCVVMMVTSPFDTHTYWTPEEQGAMANRCEANGFDWHLGDWGKVICDKNEVKK